MTDKLNINSTNKFVLPQENRLIIPVIGIDTEILEGNDLTVLEKEEGVWRFPLGKNPTQLGNMTLAGHRFQYLPPNTSTFYNLDKLKENDSVIVLWNGHYYAYQIFKIFEVYPTEIHIENDDANHPREITLYTCTPLGSAAKRLVVKAELIYEE